MKNIKTLFASSFMSMLAFYGSSALAATYTYYDENGNQLSTATDPYRLDLYSVQSSVEGIANTVVNANIGAYSTTLEVLNIDATKGIQFTGGTINNSNLDVCLDTYLIIKAATLTIDTMYVSSDGHVLLNPGDKGGIYGDVALAGGTFTKGGSAAYYEGTISGFGTLATVSGYNIYFGESGHLVTLAPTSYDSDWNENGAGSFTVSGNIIANAALTIELDVFSNNSYDSILFNSGYSFSDTSTGPILLELDFSALSLDFSNSNELELSLYSLISDTALDFTDYELSIILVEGEDAISVDLDSTYYTADGIEVSFTSNSIVFTGTAVPEPSTYAMIFGVIALGFAYYRRRK